MDPALYLLRAVRVFRRCISSQSTFSPLLIGDDGRAVKHLGIRVFLKTSIDIGKSGDYVLAPMISEINVHAGEHRYPIFIGSGLLSDLAFRISDLLKSTQGLLITDDQVLELYARDVQKHLEEAGLSVQLFSVPAGEASKSEEHLFRIYDAALDAGLDRGSFMMALGGGVVGDLAGYAAASYLRGIRLIQVPTTLLAMVDSSVGGKTGINLPKGKNLVGAFHHPKAVLADLDSLNTLPEREFSAGMAEVIKYGVIDDADLFALLEQEHRAVMAQDPDVLTRVVSDCCSIKAKVVEQDEREHGLRSILNFGHTVGHAIEQATEYGTFLHGEAISIGMVYAARVSEHVLRFPADQTQRLANLLERYRLPVQTPELAWDKIRDAIARDKKSVNRSPRFVLAERIGSVQHGIEVSDDLLASIWMEGGSF